MSTGYSSSQPSALCPLLLCIDDDRVVLECVTWLLEKHGYRTLGASCGVVGIQLFTEHAVDLVILDYEMPGMNGGEVAQQLRRLNSQVPIIMSSGSAVSARVATLVDAYVPKAGEFDCLFAAISNLLQQNGQPGSSASESEPN
jgi:DNA-binding response OmpR family regulator